MSQQLPYFIAMGCGILMTAVSQVLLKIGASQNPTLLRRLLSGPVICGYGLFFLVTVLNVLALKVLEMKVLTAFTSLTYVLTTLLSKIVLQEAVGRRQLVGCVMIALGLVVFSLGPAG